MQEFTRKVLLITGATSGIGRACALRFADAGAGVAAVGRSENALAEIAREVEKRGGQCLAIQADLVLEGDAALVVEKTLEYFGGIDVLVNAAGTIASGNIEDTSLQA